jgi:ABC-type sugar transport system permease subunit
MKPRSAQHYRRTAYAFIAPAYVIFAVFMVGPMLFSIAVSFFSWNGLRPPELRGIENYRSVFTDGVFWTTVRNTLLYSASSLFVVVPLALLLALSLNSTHLRLRMFWRAVYFAPVVASTVAVSQSFLMMFNRDFGLINIALSQLGITAVDWLGSRSLAVIPVIVVIIWRWTGLTSIYFLAGLQGIPLELYDAAEVDGAGLLQRFRHVTLSQLRPITIFVAVIVLIGSMQIFDEPQILTGGGPANATRSIVQYLYLRGFVQFRFGYASTIGFILFLSILTFSMVQMGFFREVRK